MTYINFNEPPYINFNELPLHIRLPLKGLYYAQTAYDFATSDTVKNGMNYTSIAVRASLSDNPYRELFVSTVPQFVQSKIGGISPKTSLMLAGGVKALRSVWNVSNAIQGKEASKSRFSVNNALKGVETVLTTMTTDGVVNNAFGSVRPFFGKGLTHEITRIVAHNKTAQLVRASDNWLYGLGDRIDRYVNPENYEDDLYTKCRTADPKLLASDSAAPPAAKSSSSEVNNDGEKSVSPATTGKGDKKVDASKDRDKEVKNDAEKSNPKSFMEKAGEHWDTFVKKVKEYLQWLLVKFGYIKDESKEMKKLDGN